MIGNAHNSFFARIRRKLFYRRVNGEIFKNIFPQVQRESNEGYSFTDYAEMKTETEALDVQALLNSVEGQIHRLPTAYGMCFRYIMHRDLCEHLRMFASAASRQTEPVKALQLNTKPA